MSDIEAQTRDYLTDFSRKDLSALERRFSADVTLRDWDVGTVTGRPAVLAVNRKIFESVRTIEARPLRVYTHGATGIAELEILVDGKFALFVTDVIDFDAAGHITAIRAYRGT